MPPDPSTVPSTVLIGSDARALMRKLGATAWAVLVDVSLDARPVDGGWAAGTSVHVIADHLGLTAGTVARALGRLCSAGLVRRHDRRDAVTGRFVESVYGIVATVAALPCGDCPHTVKRNTAAEPLAGTVAGHSEVRQRALPDSEASGNQGVQA